MFLIGLILNKLKQDECMLNRLCYYFFALASFFLSTNTKAQTPASDIIATPDSFIASYQNVQEVSILGERSRLLSDMPGCASFIHKQVLQHIAPINGNEIFKLVTGINVTEEEGIGLRANIGIRGLDPDRSSRVLVLEDGIPVALNPFGEPQLYYTPAIDRMEGVEILKGSGQVLFGPQTIGGVINYITKEPPKKQQTSLKVNIGQGGFLSSLIDYGNTFGNVGLQVNYLRKQADAIGATSFRINDLSSKIKIKLTPKSNLGIKLAFYDELSNATYIGLTQTMYDEGNQDFVQMAPDDLLTVRRLSASATHEYRPNQNFKLKTNVFGYTTTRDWRRQDFKRASTTNGTGIVWGDPTITNGAVFMQNSNGHRNRQFEVAGLESRAYYHYNIASLKNKLEMGARYLFEQAFEQRVNGKKKDAASGTLINDEKRKGNAISLFAQNKLELTPALSLTAGLRFESYLYERNIFRINQKDTSIVSNKSISTLIPGAGINFTPNNKLTIFAGVHRGFAPPRVADAISIEGVVYNLNPELSWNVELGTRGIFKDAISYELTLFHINFNNQIIPISESSGGSGSGLINAGSTIHQGIEAMLNIGLDKLFLPDDYALSFYANATYIDAYYNKDRFVNEINIKGNRTPYAPSFMINSGLDLTLPIGLSFSINGKYTGKQYTDELNTSTPSASGEIGILPSFIVLNGTLAYRLKKHDVAFSVSMKNITNERYIASRRPQGIRVGIPRFISFGAEVNF